MKRFLLLFFILLLLASSGVAFWSYRDLHQPLNHGKNEQYIDIPRGSTPAAVVAKLAHEGVIRHEWPLMFYMKFSGAGSHLKAGEYLFPSPISPLSVLRKLQLGEQRVMRLTIIEGWTRWDIAN